MEFVRMPGSSLSGPDLAVFDEIKVAIDQATNDYLIQPDWEANRRCVQLLNSVKKAELIVEVCHLVRQKLTKNEPRAIILTFRVLEAFVNNCGTKWHTAMNDRRFCDDLLQLARNFYRRSGSESGAVLDACLELIQSWGVGFLPHRRQYPNIVEMYSTLRKEGMPFKAPQRIDPSRMPIFSASAVTSEAADRKAAAALIDQDTDAVLAATLQESMDLELAQELARKPPLDNLALRAGYDSPTGRLTEGSGQRSRQSSLRGSPATRPSITDSPGVGRPRQTSLRKEINVPMMTGPVNAREVMEALMSLTSLLREILAAASNNEEVKRNELVSDVMQQIRTNHSKINLAIEQNMNNGELLERLFKVNDESQTVLNAFQEIKSGTASVFHMKQRLNVGQLSRDSTSRETSSHSQQTSATNSNSDNMVTDYDTLRAIAEVERSEKVLQQQQQQFQQLQQQQQQQQQRPPHPAAVGIRPVVIPPPYPHPQQAHQPPSPPNLQQSVPTRPAPLPTSPSTTKRKGATVKVDSTNSRKDSLEDACITVQEADPFAPESIDALFSNPSTGSPHNRATSKVSPTAHASAAGAPFQPTVLPPHPTIPAKALNHTDSDMASIEGSIINAGDDPFSPEALDALLKPSKPLPVAPPEYMQQQQHATYHGHQQHPQYMQQQKRYPMQPIRGYEQQVPYQPPPQQAQQMHQTAHYVPGGPRMMNADARSSPQAQRPGIQQQSQPIPPYHTPNQMMMHPGTTPYGQQPNYNGLPPHPAHYMSVPPAHQQHSATTTPSTKVDPFSPQALDAMLGLGPSAAQQHHHASSGNPSREHSREQPAGRMNPHQQQPPQLQSTTTNARDPFSPEALDALFVTNSAKPAHNAQQQHNHHTNNLHNQHVNNNLSTSPPQQYRTRPTSQPMSIPIQTPQYYQQQQQQYAVNAGPSRSLPPHMQQQLASSPSTAHSYSPGRGGLMLPPHFAQQQQQQPPQHHPPQQHQHHPQHQQHHQYQHHHHHQPTSAPQPITTTHHVTRVQH